MTHSQFEPEVLALLDEIARSPEGRLLHVPREKLPTYFGDPRETLTPHGSFLSKAERHLITAYREEAAQVLLEACVLRLKEDPQVYTPFHGDERQLRLKAKDLSPRLPEQHGSKRTLEALAHDTDLTAEELATASLRLAPRDAGYNALALSYQERNWLGSSLRVLGRFYDGAASCLQRAEAYSNMARVHAHWADYRTAYELELLACSFEGTLSRFAAWCLAAALQAGDEKSALASVRLLDERIDDSDFVEVVDGLRRGRSTGTWSPSAASTSLIHRIQASLSPRSGAICETFS